MYEQVQPDQDLLAYRAAVIEKLLRDTAFAVQQTAENPDAARVHDLRRLCLRLRHAVRFFRGVLPGRPARKIQRRLKTLQDLLGAVRCCDVALQVLQHPEVAPAVSRPEARRIQAALAGERRRSLRPLRARLRKIQRSGALGRWRSRLLGAA